MKAHKVFACLTTICFFVTMVTGMKKGGSRVAVEGEEE